MFLLGIPSGLGLRLTHVNLGVCTNRQVRQQDPGWQIRVSCLKSTAGLLGRLHQEGFEVKAEELPKQRALRPRRTRWSNRTRDQEIQLSTGAAGQKIGLMAHLTQLWTECCKQIVADVILHKQNSVIKPSTTLRRASGSLGPLVGWGASMVSRRSTMSGSSSLP